MLEESGLLNPEQLKMAMDFQKSVGGKAGSDHRQAGVHRRSDADELLARQQGIPV